MYTGWKYSSKCDVFSFGITMWEMITRKEPTFKLGPGVSSTMAVLYSRANGRRQYFIGTLVLMTLILYTL